MSVKKIINGNPLHMFNVDAMKTISDGPSTKNKKIVLFCRTFFSSQTFISVLQVIPGSWDIIGKPMLDERNFGRVGKVRTNRMPKPTI